MAFNQIVGTTGNDPNLKTTPGQQDIVIASKGDDTITADFSFIKDVITSDYIIGGDGNDTLIMNNLPRAGFSIDDHGAIDGGYIVRYKNADGNEVSNIIKSIEKFQFKEGTLTLDEFKAGKQFNAAPTVADVVVPDAVDEDTTFNSIANLVGSDDLTSPEALIFAKVDGSEVGGTVEVNADGSYTFTPTPDFNGDASFQYTANDGELHSAPATVTINFAAVNDAPVLDPIADTAEILEDSAVGTAIATAAATDVDGDTLAYTITAGNDEGLFAIDAATGEITLAAALNYEAATSHTLTVVANDGLVDSNPVSFVVNVGDVLDNAAPTVADVVVPDAVDEDTTFTSTTNLVGTDTETPDGLTYYKVDGSEVGGTVEVNADGSYTFTPTPDFNGDASFQYTAYDGELHSAPATVTINFAAVNDAPVLDPIANTDPILENAGVGAYVATAVAHDVDTADVLKYTITDGNAENLFVIDPATGEITLAAALNYEVAISHTLTVVANDGTVDSAPVQFVVNVGDVDDNAAPGFDSATLKVTAAEDAIITFTPAATDPDNDPLTYSLVPGSADVAKGIVVENADGTYTFTPSAEFAGDASFQYIASDGESSSTATVTITYTAVDDLPVLTVTPSVDVNIAALSEATDKDTLIATASAIDIDTNVADLIYTLKINGVDSDGTLFAIGTDGKITLAGSLDFDTMTIPTYTLTAGVSNVDGTNLVTTDLIVTVINEIDAVTVAVDKANTTAYDATQNHVTFNFTQGNYTYQIADFDDGDVLDVIAGGSITVSNAAKDDGIINVFVQDATSGSKLTINLTGIELTDDAAVFNVTSFKTVFGTGAFA